MKPKVIRASDYRNLRQVVPSLRRQRDVGKVEVVTEAARYIDHLHKTLIQRFILCGIPDSLKDILETDDANELNSQHIMNLVTKMTAKQTSVTTTTTTNRSQQRTLTTNSARQAHDTNGIQRAHSRNCVRNTSTKNRQLQATSVIGSVVQTNLINPQLNSSSTKLLQPLVARSNACRRALPVVKRRFESGEIADDEKSKRYDD